MNFKKHVLILTVFLMAGSAQAELARSSGQSQGTVKTGDAIWVNNLCKRITEWGDLELISPVGIAITTCSRKRDYTTIEEAYAKLEVKNCSDINLKEENPNTICVTSKGGQFKRVRINGELGIQDLASNGKVWFDAIARRVNQYEATRVCSAKSGQSLPSKADFELAESRGFREAFNGDMQNKFFWSSSVHPYIGAYAYDFNGYYGDVDYFNRAFRYLYDSARCLSAAGVN